MVRLLCFKIQYGGIILNSPLQQALSEAKLQADYLTVKAGNLSPKAGPARLCLICRFFKNNCF